MCYSFKFNDLFLGNLFERNNPVSEGLSVKIYLNIKCQKITNNTLTSALHKRKNKIKI